MLKTLILGVVSVSTLFVLTPFAQAGGGVRDFEISVAPTVESQWLAATGAVRTQKLNPHRQFDLVGFRWQSGEPRIEVQSYGRRGWSDWATAGHAEDHGPDSGVQNRERSRANSSDPVWTGPAFMIRIRVTGRVRGLRAHFVDLSQGTVNALARSASSGGVSPEPSNSAAPAPSTPGSKAGTTPPPAYVSRSQWGADTRCKPRTASRYGEVLGAVVHHTVSTNTYSQAQAPGVVLAICRYHRYSNGWHDVGYNALIDRFGTIYEGRSGGLARAVAGAHAQGFNGQTTGVALVGNQMTTPPSVPALTSLRTWLNWKLPLHGVTRNERVSYMSTGGRQSRFGYGRIVFMRAISGHRDLGSTTCPGNELFGELPGLNTMLTPSSRLATRASIRMRGGAKGSRSIYVTGRLRGAGKLLAGKAMVVQHYGDAGWTTLAQTSTDQDGIYRATVTPGKRYYIRVAFEGDSGYRSGRSVWRYSPKLP